MVTISLPGSVYRLVVWLPLLVIGRRSYVEGELLLGNKTRIITLQGEIKFYLHSYSTKCSKHLNKFWASCLRFAVFEL